MSFSLNKLILSLHLRRYIKRLKSKAETMLQQEEDEENETLAPLPSKSSLRIHVSSPNGSETSEKTNGCNNKKSRKKRHHRSRTFSTPNSPSVSILQLEAQNNSTRSKHITDRLIDLVNLSLIISRRSKQSTEYNSVDNDGLVLHNLATYGHLQ